MPAPGSEMAMSEERQGGRPEVWFYHLVQQAPERLLVDLLEKTLARGWRAVLRLGDEERVSAASERLWTYREDSFLPHGTPADGEAALQPVWITAGPEIPNEARILYLMAGGACDLAAPPEGLARICLLFQEADSEALEAARGQWRAAKAAGLKAVYWAETPEGGWLRKAEHDPSA